MDTTPGRVDINNLLALSDDILLVLRNNKDVDALSHLLSSSTSLHSNADEVLHNTKNTLQSLQDKINTCKQMISKTESETISDEDLNAVEKNLEEELDLEKLRLQELRAEEDELSQIEERMVCLDERHADLSKQQKDALRSWELLSLCASTTKLIPNLEDQAEISGYIVDQNKCSKFRMDQSLPPTEICNKLWAMIEN